MQRTLFVSIGLVVWAAAGCQTLEFLDQEETARNPQPPVDAAEDSRAHEVAGRVVDATGDGVPATAVILLDRSTGYPIDERTGQPFAFERGESIFRHLVWDETDSEGNFQIGNLPVDRYRVIAQSWDGVGRVENLFDVHGMQVTVRGFQADVRTDTDNALQLTLEPVGRGVFIYERTAGNSDQYLMVSTQPPSGDAILGPVAWQGRFAQHIVAFNRMPYGQTVVRGLPEGPFGYAVLASDSRPGFAAGSGRFIENHREIVVADRRMVAMWSDADHDPPEHLVELTEHVREQIAVGNKPTLLGILTRPGVETPASLPPLPELLEVFGPLDRSVTMPNGTEAPVHAVLAAWGYVRLQDSIARERERGPADQPGETGDDG